MESTSLLHRLQTASGRFQVLKAALLFSLPLGQASITNIILLSLFIHSLVFNGKQQWVQALKEPLWWFSAAFYAYLALSLFWVDDYALAARQLETKTSFLLAPLFIIAGTKSWDYSARSFILRAYWWGALAAMLWALAHAGFEAWQAGAFYQDSQFGRRYFFLYTHLAKPLMHPGYLATYLGFAIFVAWELQSKIQSPRSRLLYRLSMPLFLVFMLLLQARINLLALFAVIGLAALFIAWKRRAYIWLATPLLPVLALLLFMAFAPAEMQSRYLQYPDFSYDISGKDFNSATYRLAEWKCAAELIGENFWLGTGIGDNQQALMDSYRANQFWEGLEKRYNAHNQYLETMIAGGLFALLLLLSLLFYYSWRALRQRDYLALSGLLFLMICMLTESMFERMWGVLFFALIFPLLLRPSKESD